MNKEKEFAECTFSPIPQFVNRSTSANKHEKNIKENNISNNISFLSSPQLNDSCEYSDQNSRLPVQRPSLYRKIAPFQVNISFKCGIDLKNFLKRAK